MSERTVLFSLDQIGTGAMRFPSGAPVPSQSDAGVDPYFHTRVSKHVQVETVMFWPQVQETFPGLVLLHEWWGLNSQIKDQATRLACEGYVVIVPNLYVRLGGIHPCGAPVPSQSDAGVDPYFHTRVSKHVQVETVMFWPQVQETFPGLVLLHEWWGLNSQIKDQATRLACEGYVVIVPNLYVRLGGMVTASAELAETLMGRLNEKDALQDINSCCEFLNTRDHAKRNVHGVVGVGMGGALAIQFAGQRRRLRAAVAFYGTVPAPAGGLKDLCCPLQYHRAGLDDVVTVDDLERRPFRRDSHGTSQRKGRLARYQLLLRVSEHTRPCEAKRTWSRRCGDGRRTGYPVRRPTAAVTCRRGFLWNGASPGGWTQRSLLPLAVPSGRT